MSIVEKFSSCYLKKLQQKIGLMGRGGGCLVVSLLAFYSDDPSSIPTEAHSFFCKKNSN